MRVLITGAAGFIGSHAARHVLGLPGWEVLGLDSLVRGHWRAVRALEGVGGPRFQFAQVDVRDEAAVTQACAGFQPEAVLHFAALARVEESMADPQAYWNTNVDGTAALLAAMRACGVPRLVFSSSAAVYGAPAVVPVDESAPTLPVNPYGETKLAGERLIAEEVRARALARNEPLARSVPLGAVCLRYFNVAGAASDGLLGEDHDPETHLVPSALLAAAGRRSALELFGTDYPTSDGTCVRDFVHVEDLAAAHTAVLPLAQPGAFRVFNVGLGRGFSVRQVIDACSRVAGRAVPVVERPRRAGDPPVLVAACHALHQAVDWTPRHTTLECMATPAWRWLTR